MRSCYKLNLFGCHLRLAASPLPLPLTRPKHPIPLAHIHGSPEDPFLLASLSETHRSILMHACRQPRPSFFFSGKLFSDEVDRREGVDAGSMFGHLQRRAGPFCEFQAGREEETDVEDGRDGMSAGFCQQPVKSTTHRFRQPQPGLRAT
jgi:hypothetical protein